MTSDTLIADQPLIRPLRHQSLQSILIAALLATCLGGCSWFGGGKKDDTAEVEVETTEQIVYRTAQRQLRTGNFDNAIRTLEQLEARFPFGRYAEQAQLELIFARYMSVNYDSARSAADRFIRLHPNHSSVDYAYYLKGLAAYKKNSGIFDRLFSTDLSKRDMSAVQESYADFAQLLARYPDSQYVPDARQRMVYLRNLLAASELNVADFYLRRGAYVAANNRARYVVENYPGSDQVDEALVIMVECSWRLGLNDAANDALRVLATNYPNHSAFDPNGNLVLNDRVQNRDRSWANLVSLGLLDRPQAPPPIKINHPEGFVPPVREATETANQETEGKGGGWFSWLPFVG